ncbi:MAG: DNA integrity scanning protein DisA nucleotide-binding domain protein [Chloroflexi bacterium]|nr:DNA integrity scanning protein DisA nucleotide-binding domain protein [Chloroflexota bacterium]
MRVIRGTRAVQLLRGIIVFILVALALVVGLSNFLELPALGWLIDRIFPVMLLAIPIIFQPELRRALERLGGAGRYLRFWRRDQNTPMITAIAQACLRLSQRRHGALIVLEQDTGLQEYIDTGIVLNAEPSPELF